jgi:hypothetical protein
LVPQSSTEKLQAAFGTSGQFDSPSRVEQFVEIAKVGNSDLVVVDPDTVPATQIEKLVVFLAAFPARVIIYSSLSATSARTVGTLAKNSLGGVIIRGYDDTPENFFETLDTILFDPLGPRLVEVLAADLDRLSSETRRGVISAFCSTKPIGSSYDLARLCGVSRRSVDRSLRHAGLRPATCVLASSHLLRAYDFICRRRIDSSRLIARKSGFGGIRAMDRNFVALTGLLPRELVNSASCAELVANLAAVLTSQQRVHVIDLARSL